MLEDEAMAALARLLAKSMARKSTKEVLPSTSPSERNEFNAQAARIRAEYENKTAREAQRATVGERNTLRKRILAMSLFPNIYN